MFNPGLTRAFASAAIAGAMMIGTVPAHAQQQGKEITARAATASLAQLKQYYEVKNFRIGGKYDLDKPASWEFGGEGGKTLESLGAGPLRLSYIATGTPKKNAKGEIINAVIINTFYSGDSSNMYFFWQDGQPGNGFAGGAWVGKGKLIDTDRYYVVYLDALGLWGASKPSDGLGMKFPQYNFFDYVQANYRLLRDHLKIAQVELATGVSMGASQTYVWGLLHSADGFVKNIIPIGGTTNAMGEDGIATWIFTLATDALVSDPVWRETKGNYYNLPKEKHPNQGVMFHWSVLGHTGFDFDFRANQPWSAVEGDVFYWEPKGKQSANLKKKAADFDAVDLLYRNSADFPINVNKELHRIKARTLVLHIDNDNWLNANKARESAQKIPGAQIATMRDPLAHYAVFKQLNVMKNDPTVNTFLRDTGFIADPSKKFEAKNYRNPSVKMEGDPKQSFWKTQVTYPFPVKFAKGKDRFGTAWEIGYMDEYNGNEKNPDTLVIIHGKGAFGAHYGYMMKYALERGLRVVVPDLPHYGMSGPGNLDKNQARDMEQMREAIYDVVVKQLGVKKAYYHGHSLGGQFALGYALKYPQAVKGLILEGPAGLEDYPSPFKVGTKEFDLYNPNFAKDFEAWKKAWAPFGILAKEMGKDENDVRSFFNFRDPKTGAPTKSGYFKRETEYARLHTDQRVAIIKANPKEKEQYINAFIYDVYTMVAEMIRGDKNSVYTRAPSIKAPVFLAFGADEPFLPGTPLNGLKDLAKDIVINFKDKSEAAGNPRVYKVYPGAAHFIHTDFPYEFAKDTVDFIKSGKVDGVSNAVIDTLINKPQAVAANGAAAAGKPAGMSK